MHFSYTKKSENNIAVSLMLTSDWIVCALLCGMRYSLCSETTG
jgi:hypothetical protein